MAKRNSRHPTRSCGLVVKHSEEPVPLREVSIEAEIKSCLLGLQSVLMYTNNTSDPVEVMFRFPLEDSSAVVGLTAIIDGHRIKADLQEKEEARTAYDDAIASGHSAALAEEKTGDVFSITLGNLPPHKDAEIHLQVVTELSIDAEENVRFSLPSVFKPRYSPAGSTDPLAGVSNTGSQVSTAQIAGFSNFQLNVLEPDRISAITSPTHTLSRTDKADRAVVTLTEQTPADKDLVILIKHKEPHKPSGVVEEDDGKEAGFMSQKAVMVNFFPEFEHTESQCEFIFLVDRSGSMSGEFIRSASETLLLFMKSLPANCHFNIIGFGSRYEQLFPEVSVPYSQSTLDQAVAHLTGLDANLGGTELLRPLEYIFKTKPRAGLSRQVFVLTDGAVSNTEACVRKVKGNSGSSRCFTFGIGSGASTALVEGLAHAGNGSAEFVKEGERLQPKVIRSLKRALQPAVTDVSLTFKIEGNPEVLQCPQSLPPIFAGEKLVAYALVKTKKDKIAGEAILKGKILQKTVSDTVAFEPAGAERSPIPTVHHLAAKALIKDWEREGKGKKEIVKLSVESSVVSSHTAFIAVDEENSQPIGGALKTWDLQVSDTPRWMAASVSRSGRGGRTKQTARKSTGGKAARNALAVRKCSKKKKTKSGRSQRTSSVRSGPPPPPFLGRRSRSRSRSRDRELLDYDLEYDDYEAVPTKRARMDYDNIESDSDSDHPETSSGAKPSSSASAAFPKVSLSSIVGAQQADGSWKMNAALARFVEKSLQEVKAACPTECTGVVGSVWATLLMLELLHSQYTDDQAEWELVGTKAESWTKKQTLPESITLDIMKAAAKTLLA